jgi:hypothetical protein
MTPCWAGSSGLNRYTYCGNNPLKYVDPSGNWFFTPILGPIGVIIDGALWGATISAATYTVATIVTGTQWNLNDCLTSAGIGAITGAITGGFNLAFGEKGVVYNITAEINKCEGFTLHSGRIIYGGICGAFAGGVDYVASSMVYNQEFNTGDFLLSMLAGGAIGSTTTWLYSELFINDYPIDDCTVNAVSGKYYPQGEERLHSGIDLGRRAGAALPEIHPTRAGMVTGVFYLDAQQHPGGFNPHGLGNFIEVTHIDGVKSYYGHMSAIFVKEGQIVTKFTAMGIMGNTGNVSPPRPGGIHLHFEIRIKGDNNTWKWIPPMSVLPDLSITTINRIEAWVGINNDGSYYNIP